MTNKLRLSTAIIGSLAGLGLSAAVAQTTVSGNAAFGFFASSTDNASKDGSYSVMTKETQINLATKGKLNNGMDYAAGFSIEMDGPDAVAAAAHAEGNYLEIISGNTTFHVGADRIQNADIHYSNANGIGYIGQDGLGAGAVATAATGTRSIFPLHGSIYSFFGTGLIQKTGYGNFSVYYVPNMTVTVLNDISNGATATAASNTSATSAGDALEIGFKGNLGVNGLTAHAFYTSGGKQAEFNALDKDVKTYNVGGAYTVGKVTASAQAIKTEGVQSGHGQVAANNGTNGTLGAELKGKSVGLAYALDKELTLGLAYGKADSNEALSVRDEKTYIASIGYSLGAVGIKAQVADVSNYAGLASNDGKTAKILMFTSF
jgi:hypothetical protein